MDSYFQDHPGSSVSYRFRKYNYDYECKIIFVSPSGERKKAYGKGINRNMAKREAMCILMNQLLNGSHKIRYEVAVEYV